MKNALLAALLTVAAALPAFSQDAQKTAQLSDKPKRQYQTQRVAEGEITFDGKLDEAAWQRVEAGGGFTENQPDDGSAPTFQSEFRILYDDKFLYVGYRGFDPSPDSIVRRMGRRDEFPGDWFEINIDSYHDLRTAFSFTFSCSGVRGDEFVSGNGENWDTNWNPVWDGQSNIDEQGWTAEIKIPFSQLRYNRDREQVWGFQVMRRIFRREERSTFQHIPQNGSGWVSRFAELHGLRDLPHNRGVELAPYALAQHERFEKEEGNPFADGTRNRATVGLDGKLSVTRDLILDYTVNPDFGQVEADPGAIRLDGFQVFFNERRPFFMESRNLFDYTLTGSAGGWDFDSDLLFYSRRIGGRPHAYPSLAPGEHADVPQATSILASAKFSGKTKKGWSVGLLESVTRRENAQIDLGGERRDELVEPRTNYFVGRLMKDFDQGNTIIGAALTAVNREKGLDWLHRAAYSGGADFQRFWKNRWFAASGNLLVSRVEGSAAAILETQRGFEHLFQRPGASHVEVDPGRTSLTGTSGTFKLGKYGGKQDHRGGIVKFEVGGTWRSPEFEVNDIGFMQTADDINHWAWLSYQVQRPFSVFRNMRLNYNHWTKWDFSGRNLFGFLNTNGHATFRNSSGVGLGLNYNPYDISNTALRGGPAMRRPAGMGTWAYFNSDQRKRLTFEANPSYFFGFDNVVSYFNASAGAGWQALDRLQFGVYPGYSRSHRRQDQYVAEADFGAEKRYIVSGVEQQSLSLTVRSTLNLTPDLTVQFYGQPFIFRALYKNYGRVTAPLARGYADRFHRFSENEISASGGGFDIDEDGDGQADYGFGKPDFNYVQFRSNLVMRWEYVPGSELFVVWSQGATPQGAFGDLGSPLVSSLFDNLFDERPVNIFLVKATFRLLR